MLWPGTPLPSFTVCIPTPLARSARQDLVLEVCFSVFHKHQCAWRGTPQPSPLLFGAPESHLWMDVVCGVLFWPTNPDQDTSQITQTQLYSLVPLFLFLRHPIIRGRHACPNRCC
jgi:hypothetical protein